MEILNAALTRKSPNRIKVSITARRYLSDPVTLSTVIHGTFDLRILDERTDAYYHGLNALRDKGYEFTGSPDWI